MEDPVEVNGDWVLYIFFSTKESHSSFNTVNYDRILFFSNLLFILFIKVIFFNEISQHNLYGSLELQYYTPLAPIGLDESF